MRVAKEEMAGMVLLFCFFALRQQGGLGGGISVVIVGRVVGFSSGSGSGSGSGGLGESCRLSFAVLASSVGGRESRTQQQGPRDLSHWHPVFFVVSDDSVKASSQVTKILISTSMPEARS